MNRIHLLILLLLATSNISSAQDCLDTESYYQYIKENGQPHLEYVLDKIRSHSVVAIGEDHWIDAHPQFLCELIHIKNMQMFSNPYGKTIKRNRKVSEHVSFWWILRIYKIILTAKTMSIQAQGMIICLTLSETTSLNVRT